jgi:[ribosomal protein S18]-alanine N-acetyltransferase
LRVRRAQAHDISAMMVLQRENPSAAQWSQEQYDALFGAASVEGRSERLAWIADDDAVAGGILAFLVAQRVDTEWELENIVVAGSKRRRGVAAGLLGKFIAHARAAGQGREIFLEVRESNLSARALYRKLGFEETGLRKSYYSNPPEDAILCRLSFIDHFS